MHILNVKHNAMGCFLIMLKWTTNPKQNKPSKGPNTKKTASKFQKMKVTPGFSLKLFNPLLAAWDNKTGKQYT